MKLIELPIREYWQDPFSSRAGYTDRKIIININNIEVIQQCDTNQEIIMVSGKSYEVSLSFDCLMKLIKK